MMAQREVKLLVSSALTLVITDDIFPEEIFIIEWRGVVNTLFTSL